MLEEREGGEPEIESSKPIGPGDYAEVAQGWIADGATVICGCCYNNPDSIAALRRIV